MQKLWYSCTFPGAITDDSLSFDFGVFADRVVNQPAPRQKLRGVGTDVLDADEIRKYVMTSRRF